MEGENDHKLESGKNEEKNKEATRDSEVKKDAGGTFACSFCSLKERFDYKGSNAPFAKQLYYLEDAYVAKDPFSLPNKGEVLVLGGDCSVCGKAVCLDCSIFYSMRFCRKCAVERTQDFPAPIQTKIKSFAKDDDADDVG